MASNGIRDRVAIVGMGCTSFGERWDKSVSDLLVESSQDALNSANVPINAQAKPSTALSNATVRAARALSLGSSTSTATPANER